MPEFFHEIDLAISLFLFISGLLAFIISTISGGGGALILVPILNWLIGTGQTAPVLNLGTLIGRPSRLIIFWKYINWKVVWYYVPSALLGALLAAWVFRKFNVEWLQLLVGIFLVSTVFQYRFGKKKQSFKMELWYFIPLGLLVSILGTIIGALGPVLNPFYLNMGLEKEDLIATKTANSFFMGIAQISSYSFFGLLHHELWVYGLSLGMGATAGNIIGKKFLARMKSITFRKLLIILMVISGLILIYKQLGLFL